MRRASQSGTFDDTLETVSRASPSLTFAVVLGCTWAVCAGACSVAAPHGGLEGAVRLGRADAPTAALLEPNPAGYSDVRAGFASPGYRQSLEGERASLAVLLPKRASDAIALGPGYAAPFRFSITPEGAASTLGTVDEGRVIYRDVFEGVDEIAVARPWVAEQFYVLSSPHVRHDYAWKFALPSGANKVESRSDGIWFLDARGGFVLRVPAPFYLDARGRKASADYSWNQAEQTLTVRVPHEPAEAYPLLLDPAFESRVWQELRAPYNIVHANFVYDAERKESLLFGDNQTWLWNGTAWNEHTVARGGASPGARYSPSMMFDEKRKTTVLYGGVEPSGIALDSTWSWNGSEWKNVSTATAPPGHVRGGLAYDRLASTGVHFGGQASFFDYTVNNETWLWDGVSWQAASVVGAKPSARAAHGMVYDVTRNRIVMYGGYDNVTGSLQDTWEWANQTWTRVTSADAAPNPGPRHSFAMAYDEARDRVVLFGGIGGGADTWTFNGTKWKLESTAVSPPPLSDAAATFDRTTKRVLLSGGQTPTGANNNLWSWDGTVWRAEHVGDLPQPFTDRPLLFEHAQRKELLHFAGGAAPDELRRPGYAWAHSGREWSPRTFLGVPLPRSVSDMTYDAARGSVVLFGGSADALLQDTWVYKNGEWLLAAPKTQPSARIQHKLAYHPGSGRVVLFGGTDDAGMPGDTWTWDGQEWTKLQPASSPPPRRGHALGLDPHTGNLLLVGGWNTQGQPLGDTWTWNGVTWTNVNPPTQIDMSRGVALLCSPSDCFLAQQGGEMYRFNAANDWEKRADVPGANWNTDTSPTAVWDPRFNAFFLSCRDTLMWQPSGEQKFAADSSKFYEGPIAWTGSETIRFSESDDSGRGGTFYVRTPQGWFLSSSLSVFPVRNGASAYDGARNIGTVVGSDQDGGAHLWTWDGSTMRLRANLRSSSAGAGMAMAYHAPSQQTVIFGDEGTERNLTYLWNGTALSLWTPPNNGAIPQGRYAAAAAYDPKSAKVILFGGRDDTSYLNDTWAWDGASWTLLSPNASPPARANHAMTYDGTTQTVLLMGGDTASGPSSDVWSWDGSTWSTVVTKVIPPARALHAMAHLASAHRTIVFGGYPGSANATTTFPWAFYTRGGACTQDADCGTGSCVDGVCCEVASCGTCQTCAGTDPGVCTPVINAEDPDSCPAQNHVSCNELGQCGPALGGACTSGSDCGSGNCVDGICCDSACDKPCEACSAKTKSSGKDDGRCGLASVGTNPGKRCSGGATCSAIGVCAENTGTFCRDGRYLEDLAGTTTDCAPYRCSGSCLTRCSSANDCVFPATCDPHGICGAPGSQAIDDGGACSAGRGSGVPTPATGALGVVALGIVGVVRKRARTFSSRRT